jgi:multidrug transporter EmrE-like cation transporter
MATQKWAIALVLFFTLLTSAAQIFLKLASEKLELNLIALLTNWPLLIGGILYVISAILLIIALRGGELSVLYPLVALSYVWVSLVSPRIFPTDSMNPLKWVGIAFIIGGVGFIGAGSQK